MFVRVVRVLCTSPFHGNDREYVNWSGTVHWTSALFSGGLVRWRQSGGWHVGSHLYKTWRQTNSAIVYRRNCGTCSVNPQTCSSQRWSSFPSCCSPASWPLTVRGLQRATVATAMATIVATVVATVATTAVCARGTSILSRPASTGRASKTCWGKWSRPSITSP